MTLFYSNSNSELLFKRQNYLELFYSKDAIVSESFKLYIYSQPNIVLKFFFMAFQIYDVKVSYKNIVFINCVSQYFFVFEYKFSVFFKNNQHEKINWGI